MTARKKPKTKDFLKGKKLGAKQERDRILTFLRNHEITWNISPSKGMSIADWLNDILKKGSDLK